MNETNTSDHKKELAKNLFVNNGKTIKDIAVIIEIEEAAIRNWIQLFNWEGLKLARLTSKEHQLHQLYLLLDNLNSKMLIADEINPKDVDMVVKYTAAIKNLDAEVGIPEIVEVAKLFINWLKKTAPIELCQSYAEKLDQFLKHKLQPIGA